MINTKELMLGNWVYDSERTKFPMKVVNIDKDMVYLDFEDNEGDVFDGKDSDICPIPLTEEIFDKNGFKYLCGVYYLEEDTNIEFRKEDDGYFYLSFDLSNYVLSDKPIKYVHQLQNILTIAGIEIEFKI